MQHRNIRSLPPRERAEALRKLLRDRLPHIPHAVVRFPSSKRARHGKGIHSFAMAAGLLAAATLAPTHGAHAGTLDIDVTTTAIHTRAWARRSLNQVNPGLGLEYRFTRTWGVMGGEYKNSYSRPTWYAAATFTPLHLGRTKGWRADAGVGVGLATGYTRRENSVAPLMAAGVLRVRAPGGVGVNLLWVPNQPHGGAGLVGLQIAIPLR